jgi:uncharacterized protein YijF (DUF1287 family)
VRARSVPGIVAVRAKTRGRSVAISSPDRDDRLALALLLAPFVIVALSLVAERTARQFIASTPRVVVSAQYPEPAKTQSVAVPTPPVRIWSLNPASPPAPLPDLALLLEPPPAPLPDLALLLEPPPAPLPDLALLLEPPPAPLPDLALLVGPPLAPLPDLALLTDLAATPPLCQARSEILAPRTQTRAILPPRDATAFGLALSDAARAQLGDLVIYNPNYVRIAYPMGDVPSLFGVCTDVVVRAYRTLGIDLQALVQQTRSGRGDPNIDHRRVEVVRRFLARHGRALPVSEFPEDYQPGDIVTYYRPQNRVSTAHIAIVTDQIAPSGRPMIVHNRGWGPEMEDALFVDQITGHYRFSGMTSHAPRLVRAAPIARKRLAGEASISGETRDAPRRQ